MTTPDKRDECGCHRECTVLAHTCAKPCRWPACLNPEETDDLLRSIDGELF